MHLLFLSMEQDFAASGACVIDRMVACLQSGRSFKNMAYGRMRDQLQLLLFVGHGNTNADSWSQVSARVIILTCPNVSVKRHSG